MRRLALALLALLAPVAARAELPTVAVKVIRTYPHDPRAFTEGLFWHAGFLYESTGEPGRAFIRKVDLAPGHVHQPAALAAPAPPTSPPRPSPSCARGNGRRSAAGSDPRNHAI